MIWTQADTNKLAALLSTSPLIAELEDNEPSLDGDTMEDRAMASSERLGFENCIKKIIELATMEEQAQLKTNFVTGIEGFADPAPPTNV